MNSALHNAVKSISSALSATPTIGMILGSGLGTLAEEIQDAIHFPYAELEGFPQTTVKGHAGRLVFGELAGMNVVAMQGRSHFYEHQDMSLIAYPVRFMKALGIEQLLVTNACGGIRADLYPGALMLISDHINLMGDNPLIGQNRDEEGPRFPDMSEPYSVRLRHLAKSAAKELNIEIKEGVHSAVSGPYYLSRAELMMVRTMGADTIGMSTIPEAIVGTHLGLEILGISCVTDMAIPEELSPLTHAEVIAVANQAKERFSALIKKTISTF